MTEPRARATAVTIAVGRMGAGAVVIGILIWTYLVGIPRQGANLFDYFGYFTNLTSVMTGITLVVTGILLLRRAAVPDWLTVIRGVAVACMIVVALIYNLVVPGTGTAPPWVSFVLHILFPAFVVLDWLLASDRPPLPWRRLWIVLPYPVIWLVVVLIRGVTDGWVPYGFLLPERGVATLLADITGLLATLLAAGALVWAMSRVHVLPTPIG